MHGLVGGRGTSGSAVIGFDDPICGVSGTVTTWACITPPKQRKTIAAPKRSETEREMDVFFRRFSEQL